MCWYSNTCMPLPAERKAWPRAAVDVLVLQFFKPASGPSGECAWDGIGKKMVMPVHFRRLEQRHPFFDKQADRPKIRKQILEALAEVRKEMQEQAWDLVVLDEINIALRDKYVTWEEF